MTNLIIDTSILDNLDFDAENYLENANDWTPAVANAIAYEIGLDLTDRHWMVLNFARATYEQKGDAPTIRQITKGTPIDTKELYTLFPGGPAKVAAQIAGLKKPTGCV